MKRLWILMLLCAFLMTGCASSADTLASPSPAATETQPAVMPSVMPENSSDPSASPSPGAEGGEGTTVGGGGGVTTLNEAKQTSEQIDDAVEKLTEVADAEVVAVGTLALVGVQFDDQYKGGLDDRVKKMILARAQTVDSEIDSVAVTDDESLVSRIEELSDALESASSLGEIAAQAETLAEQIGTYRE